jgi:hypothetical protein
VGVIYRPSDAKIKNAQKKDYLGQAKLIAATDAKDGFTGFTGAEIKKVCTPLPDKSDRLVARTAVTQHFTDIYHICNASDGKDRYQVIEIDAGESTI